MIKNVNISKGRDEINVYSGDGKLLMNVRVAGSSRRLRADLSIKTNDGEIRIVRDRINDAH